MSEIEGVKQEVTPWTFDKGENKKPKKTPDLDRPVPTLWRFYDSNEVLLYASRGPNANALTYRPWWRDVDHINVQHFETDVELFTEYRETIQIEQPKYNIHNKPRD